jgi:hypothetical protein
MYDIDTPSYTRDWCRSKFCPTVPSGFTQTSSLSCPTSAMLRNAISTAARPLLSQSVCSLFSSLPCRLTFFIEICYNRFWRSRPESACSVISSFLSTYCLISAKPPTKYGGIYTVGCAICFFVGSHFTRLGNPHTWGRYWNRNYRLRERDI